MIPFSPRHRGSPLLCICALWLTVWCGCAPRPSKTVTFRVVCNPLPDTSAVYLVGNHALLGKWNPGAVPMTRQPDGMWKKSISIEEGSKLEFKFTRESVLRRGDTVLLMSDGFPEMFNAAGETLDYPNAREAFEGVAHLAPGEIIVRLVRAGEEWAGGRTLEDDVTFVVLKVK